MTLDLSKKPARFGCARFGATRFGFQPRTELVQVVSSASQSSAFVVNSSDVHDVNAALKIFYIWTKEAHPTTVWTRE